MPVSPGIGANALKAIDLSAHLTGDLDPLRKHFELDPE